MSDLIGKHIRGYELKEQIGHGGFGAVYRATQAAVDRDVAIKVILPEYANDPDFIRSFEAEAALIARLEHFHIIPLYDYWREPDGAYLVTRYLSGGSLRERLETRGALTAEQAVLLVDQVSAAMNIAHRQGVIHRDIKPANILLDRDGNAYLGDFGISISLGTSDADELSKLVGTPGYLAPEQFMHENVTPQSDIYSFGIVIFEALTGSRPFPDSASPIRIMQFTMNEPLPAIADYRSDLPHDVENVILRATAKNPKHRFVDALSLARDFRAAFAADLDLDTLKTGEIQVEETAEMVSRVRVYDSDRTMTPASTGDFPFEVVVNPYKGLRAFQEADADDFFGREYLIDQLLSRFAEHNAQSRFLAVVGPSGCGKSSVVKAGLIPRLKAGALPNSDKWFTVEMFPGTHPFEELEAALLRVAVNPPDSLYNQLCEDHRGLVRAVKRILPGDESSELLLVIDQFEELFTLVEQEALRQQFVACLLAAAQDPRSQVRIVVTLRADFYDRPLLYEGFGRLMEQRTQLVLPLTAKELEQSIIRPAQNVNVRFETGLVHDIFRDVEAQPGTLPLLQYALTELFERRRGTLMTVEAYQAMGGVMGALARRADDLFEALDVQTQPIVRQLFLRLVTLGEGTEDTRRRVRRSEIAMTNSNNRLLNEVIDRFGKFRLLTFDRDPMTREPTIEVAHEALLRKWSRFREWITANRDDVRIHRRVTIAAAEWEEADRDVSYLAVGARLVELESWVVDTELAFNVTEQEFLEASLAHRDELARFEAEQAAHKVALQRRATNRLRYLVVGLAVFLVVAVVLSLIAFDQQQHADDERQSAINAQHTAVAEANSRGTAQADLQMQFNVSESQRLAIAANSVLEDADVRLETALLLTIRSLNITYTEQADELLVRLVNQFHIRRQLIGHTSIVRSVAVSPDGRLAATSSRDETARMWDVETGQTVYILQGHTDDVLNVAWSPDGTLLLTGSADNTAGLWDAATGTELHVLAGHTERLWTVAWSPTGQTVVTGSSDDTARLWDVATGAELHILAGHSDNVLNAVFSPDGTQVVTGSVDGTARVWDVATGVELQRLVAHSDRVWSVAWSPSGEFVLTGSADRTGRIWNATTGETQAVLVGHLDTVTAVAWSPNGEIVVTGGADGDVRVWDATTGEQRYQLQGHTDDILSMAVSPDGRLVLTGSLDRTARLWDIETGMATSVLVGHTDRVTGVAWSPDGQSVLTGGADGLALFWNVTSGGDQRHTLADHTNSLLVLAWSPDGARLLSAGLDGTARIWDANTGDMLQVLSGHESWVWSGAWSPDGSKVLTGGTDGTVRVWDAETGVPLAVWTGHTSDVNDIVFSPDGRTVLTSSIDYTARLWEAETGTLLHVLTGHSDDVTTIDWSPQGDRVITGGLDGTARVWDAETGALVFLLSGHISAVNSVAWSPNRDLIATGGGDSTIRLWNVETGEPIAIWEGHQGRVRSVVFSSDGRQIVSGSDDSTARVWDVATGNTILVLQGHTNGVARALWSNDGRFLLTTSADRTARLWDAHTGAVIRVLRGHTNALVGAGFSPNSRWVATMSDDHTLRLWETDYHELVAYACTRMFRDFTPEERLEFGLDDTSTCPPFATE